MFSYARYYIFVSITISFTGIYSLDLCSFSEKNTTVTDSYIWKNQSTKNCGCQNCIRKCCKPGYFRILGSNLCFKNSTDYTFKVPVYTDENNYVKDIDEINYFTVGPIYCAYFNYPAEDFYIQTDGTVWIPVFDRYFYNNQYCVDENNGLSLLLCIPPEKVLLSAVGMIISMPFLLITFLVYLILPERNVHRRALINYVFSLLCGYISLVTVQLYRNDTSPLGDIECHTIGYAIVFFFIVSFFWMNVMCIDMWLAFSGLRGFGGRKNAEQKKFILFCIYAWGMPALLILLIFLMNTYADIKAIYHPQLGKARCFLEEGYPNLFYFYLPMAILITVNIILCILTAVKIRKVKKETSMLKHGDSKRHSYENDKQKFKLYIKLIFAMGINWSMEVISYVLLWQFHEMPTYVWYLTDFTNASYGVLIFLIFVFKKNVWVQLKKRYYIWRGQPHFAHSLSSTQATRTSNFSAGDAATVSNDYRLNILRTGKLEEKPSSVD